MVNYMDYVNNVNETENKEEAREVGKISYEALMKAKDMIKPGAKLIDVANEVENFVIDKGYDIAFPLNLSINDEAAHYTPAYMNTKTFGDNDVVKVDFGAAKDGYLGDCAVTVDLSGEYSNLVDATKEALENAVSIVKAGVEIREIGKIINKTIVDKGFIPIKNLGGHGVNIHELHAEPFIANFDNGDDTKLVEGRRIAIEPFATLKSAKGLVTESETAEIFGFVEDNPSRLPYARNILSGIKDKYNSEPFAARWLADKVKSKFELYSGINDLIKMESIEPYNVLVEISGGMVAQTEYEMIVEKDSCDIITKL